MSRRIFKFTNELESLGINYNIAVIPFFNENQDLPRFPKFVKQIRKCSGEIGLHGLFHNKSNGELDDFHTRSRGDTEIEVRAGLQIFEEIGLHTNVFVPPRWKLNRTSTNVLQKLGFTLAETQEKFIMIGSSQFKKIHVSKVLSWDSYGDAEKNAINIPKNRKHFEHLIDGQDLVRIALHPKDPLQSLSDQKHMILELKNNGYKTLTYSQLIRNLR